MNIAQGGLSWICFSLAITLVLWIITFLSSGLMRAIGVLGSVLFSLITIGLVVFFRDPERVIGTGIVAVADGFIQEVSQEKDTEVGDCIRISTFMNIHNVHVNRMPVDGTITHISHHAGAHLPAFTKESKRNERVTILVATKIGTIKIIQIAGTLARRIVPYVKKGDKVKKGTRIGLIRLGSRVDIYLPARSIKTLTVATKQRVKAGGDTIALIDA